MKYTREEENLRRYTNIVHNSIFVRLEWDWSFMSTTYRTNSSLPHSERSAEFLFPCTTEEGDKQKELWTDKSCYGKYLMQIVILIMN